MASNILKVFVVNSENEEQICDIMDAIIRDPSTIKVSRFSDQGYECLEIERENGTESMHNGTAIKGDWRCDDDPLVIADQLMATCDTILN